MKPVRFIKHILLLFFMLLFTVPVIWLVNPPVQESYSYVEGRSLASFPALPQPRFKTVIKRFLQLKPAAGLALLFNGFLDREYQHQFEAAASDQFPLRLQAIRLAKAIDRGVIQASYVFLPDTAIPADMHSGLLVTRGDSPNILFPPETFDEMLPAIIDARIENYATLMSSYPEIHFYVFNMQRLENSNFHPLNLHFPNADRGQALAYFESQKPLGLTLSVMKVNSYADHVSDFYATDHHLSMQGLGRAYHDLYDMLSLNYPGISPKLNLEKVITFQNARQQGSLARTTLYPMGGDVFQVYDLDTPPFTVYSKWGEYPLQEKQRQFIRNYSTMPFQEYYGQYFDLQNSIYDFEFHNNSDRNLLVIGSSFVRGVIPMIAAHYHHTYYIDLRQNTLFLSEFLSEHPVDDIVIFGDNPVTFTDPAWSINP